MPTTVMPLLRARTTNATTAAFGSFTAKAPTLTQPVTSAANGVFDLLDRSLGLGTTNSSQRFIQLIPFGAGSNNDTFDMRLWGWSETSSALSATPIYIPQLLVELNVVLGNIAGTVIAASTLMADTITIAKGDLDSSRISPANDLPASILVHLRGCRYIEFDFDSTSSSPSMNAFFRLVDQS